MLLSTYGWPRHFVNIHQRRGRWRGGKSAFTWLNNDLKDKEAPLERAERVVCKKNLGGYVRFLSFLPDVPCVIPAFSAITLPSHMELLDNATNESVVFGLPVVVARIGGITAMVADGPRGVMMLPRNSTGLADTVEAFMRQPERARARGGVVSLQAERMFSVEPHARCMQDVYDRPLSVDARLWDGQP